MRHSPFPADYRFYIQGIAEWFVCEDAPYLSHQDVTRWLQSFCGESLNVLDDPDFSCEETEYIVTGVWNGPRSLYVSDM